MLFEERLLFDLYVKLLVTSLQVLILRLQDGFLYSDGWVQTFRRHILSGSVHLRNVYLHNPDYCNFNIYRR